MVLLVATLCKSDKVERLYQAEGLPKNISTEFCKKHGVDNPTFDTWYRKTHKKVCPVTVTGMPANEEDEIQVEAEKVSVVRVRTCVTSFM